jgi:peroxiredoxin Q/BCP
MLQEGAKVPEFSLPDAEGKVWASAGLSGSVYVLYFYPKDDTPGCTVEACSFRDSWGEFEARGVKILGVSPDTSTSHAKFARKHSLPFILLADPDKKAIEAFGAFGEKSMYGRKYMGVLRSTFVIDEKGIIAKVFPKVTPAGHAAEILAAIDALKA